MMIVLAVLGVLLLAGALYVCRGFFLIAVAKSLNARAEATMAETAELNARTAELEAETADLEARAKASKASKAVALGFVPEEELDTTLWAPRTPERQTVLDALRAGDWEAGAAYVEAAGQEWEERWQRVVALADLAAEDDDAWLLAWRAARPADPVAAVVGAETGVRVAWNVRGRKRASYTTQEQFRLFGELLNTAQRAAHEAQHLADPADPLPYMVEQHIGHGLGYSHERYRALWEQITARDPKVLSAHTNALEYWCQKWRGSHALAHAFAAESAAAGAPGDLLSLLPLIAYFEQEQHERDLLPETWYQEPGITAAVDAAVQDLAEAGPGHPGLARMRHMLAYLLFWQDRDADAVEQFRHVDGYIGTVPWSYDPSPRRRYLYARDWAIDVTTPEA
ncbi:hypothetical protein OOK31_12810 [Streptomyces sp. NBC_00249]|uniref:hypothetical protein n=1 Tax=Streptomyces sp. NBC_00249 TaxID=2975690 RepID=UPI0022557EC7|nr:hypothetical protein [Streptomyces sp. NBC_00249]MCX5194768.1 hypothetical protein [Streptomyces sp. NBC_00249]